MPAILHMEQTMSLALIILRDNMVLYKEQKVQKPLYLCCH